MTRILFVSTSTTLGGAEKTVYTLATRLDRSAFEIAGVVSVKPAGIYAERLSRAKIPVHALGSWRNPKALLGLIKELRPDIVHAVMYQAIQLCRLAKILSPVPFKLISSPRVSYRTRSWPTLLVDRLLRSRDDLLISESETSRMFLTEKLGYDPAKVATIHNGLELPAPAPPDQRQKKRAELGIKSGESLIGAIGRLDRQKGQDTLLRAMPLTDRTIRCLIIGNGPQREALEKLAASLSLSERAIFLGERQDASEYLPALDVFVLPSRWEGLPNALLDAMAAGLPVIASGVDGVLEAVADGENGLLALPEDTADWASKITAISRDAEKRARLGAAARETVAKKFRLSAMIANYQRAFRNV